MQICHIISGDLWAGAEVMTYQLLKGLKKYENMEISTILLNEGKLAEEIRKLGIPVNVVDETRLNFLEIVRNVRKIITLVSPDVIHSHRQKENILAYLSARSDRKIQLVCTQHGMPEPLSEKFKIIKHIILSKIHYYILLKYFRYVIAVSEDIRKNFIRKNGFPENKMVLIFNGTEIKIYPSKEERNNFVIGSAGRLFPIKNYSLMVEIAREILHRTDQVRFELAGEGPERGRILDLIHKYKMEKTFILRGFLADMTTFYQGLDLYINTSLHEGFPMSVLEAMAHGLPVIASNTGGLKEILNNEFQGYLVNGSNPILFADRCLQLYRDKALTKKMGIASSDKIKKEFSLDKMWKNYYEFYFNVLEQT